MTPTDKKQIKDLYCDCFCNDQVFAEQIKITYLYTLYGMTEIWKALD